MSLYCLVYTSIANQKMSDDNLKDLLKKSRVKNERKNVTGMLLYLDPFFIQILEGEEAIVNESFNLIKQDSRHHKVKIIYKKPIEQRSFENWTMGFNKISNENLEAFEGFSDFLQRPTSHFFSDSPSETEKMLEKFLDMFKHETLF
jgi:hypothetical protein